MNEIELTNEQVKLIRHLNRMLMLCKASGQSTVDIKVGCFEQILSILNTHLPKDPQTIDIQDQRYLEVK